ncbi:flagellar protein FliT [Burkholderia sp. FERM BP-3421]|jgi:flagellar protein FliT|uniref:flagellar protein FliT n=1 Tax=Burkholderia sp. FERM BP-3421 TaxID=1494466 RepID=UPI0023615FD0|nr:flagellar protein FliT [Burkholderia sp. FERM BP-3421]WDD95651.1 flagellar protein FliT [Burkholderia sp. FERM BP-3421]
MSPKAEYIARYEAIAAVSGRMLIAARGEEWQALGGLQEEYLRLVDSLKEAAGPGIALDESERGRKYELIRQILADDAAIRDLASPDVARLSALFETGRSTKVLKDLYQARR